MGTMSVPSKTLCCTSEVAKWGFLLFFFLTERNWNRKSSNSNSNSSKGFVLFLL